MTQLAFDEANYCGTGPENYQRFFVPAIGEPLANDLIVSADLKPGENVLDVACGTGVVTRLAAEQVGQSATVAGLDVNPGMLSVARTVTPKEQAIDWYETSAEAMPPKPLNAATICGIAVIWTRTANQPPMIEPTTRPATTVVQLRMSSETRVITVAANMPVAAIRLPVRAVRGVPSCFNPTMNATADARYRASVMCSAVSGRTCS